jgi:hypothetical protein
LEIDFCAPQTNSDSKVVPTVYVFSQKGPIGEVEDKAKDSLCVSYDDDKRGVQQFTYEIMDLVSSVDPKG